VGKGCGAP